MTIKTANMLLRLFQNSSKLYLIGAKYYLTQQGLSLFLFLCCRRALTRVVMSRLFFRRGGMGGADELRMLFLLIPPLSSGTSLPQFFSIRYCPEGLLLLTEGGSCKTTSIADVFGSSDCLEDRDETKALDREF